MKKSFKMLGAFLSCTLLSTGLFAKSDELVLLPMFTDSSWESNIEVAGVFGSMDFDKNDGTVYGVELSFDCPVFTLPGDNLLRQQLSVSKYDEKGFEVTVIEMNPYYFIDLSEKLKLGFGPGISAVHGDAEGVNDQWLFGVQAGAGLKYYINDFIIGADLRFQWTAEKDFGTGSKEDLDNTRLLMKAGYSF